MWRITHSPSTLVAGCMRCSVSQNSWLADGLLIEHTSQICQASRVPDARSEPQGAPRQPRMQRLADADRPSVASTVLESKEAHLWPALHTSCFFQHALYLASVTRYEGRFLYPGPAQVATALRVTIEDRIVGAKRSWSAGSMMVRSCADGARYSLFNSRTASSGGEAANSGGQGESSVAHCSM